MFAATSSWDIFASGGAFSASLDINDSWAAFTCECVVLLVSPEKCNSNWSTINNILRILNLPAVNTLIV